MIGHLDNDGALDGNVVGTLLGLELDLLDGTMDGKVEGLLLLFTLGIKLCINDGCELGIILGLGIGWKLGALDGSVVGTNDGCELGMVLGLKYSFAHDETDRIASNCFMPLSNCSISMLAPSILVSSSTVNVPDNSTCGSCSV